MPSNRSAHRVAAAAAVAALCAVSLVAAADSTLCPDDLNALFRVAEQESLGVWVTDRAAVIGGVVADEKFHNRLLNAFMPLPGWYPVDGTKRIVCGTLEYWNVYRGPSPELDLHSYIVPSPSFLPILHDLPPYGTTDAGHSHVWGEITPPAWFEPFWRVPGVPLKGGDNACGRDEDGAEPHACKTTLWNQETACMYGPWIMERVYNYRVEIHPVQMMWGKDGDVLRLFVLSDNSQRFAEARSYRRKTATEQWFPWSNPIAPTVWIAAEAQPQQTLAMSVTRGSLTPAASGPVTITAVDLSGASVAVTHSPDLRIGRGPSCRTTSGAIRGFVAVSASGANEIQALDIRGDVLSRPRPRTPIHTDETITNTETEKEGDAGAPSIDLQAVEWFEPEPLSAAVPLPRTRSDWGFSAQDKVRWTYARQQRLLLRVTIGKGSPPPPRSRFWVNWDVEACDVEAGGSGCRPIPLGSGPDDLRLEVSHGSQSGVSVPDGVDEKKNAGPGELRVFLRYPVPHALGADSAGRSIRVKLSATLTDVQGRHATFTQVLRSIAPDFSAQIQQYDVEKEHGAIPEQLIVWMMGWLRQQGVPVSRADLEADWKLAAASNGEILGPIDRQERRRMARVLRLSLLTFLEDRTLDADEMKDIFEMLQNYATAVWRAS